MSRLLRRRALLGSGLALASIGLARRAQACEFFTVNLRVFMPWARATRAGDSTAVVCMQFDDVRVSDRLVGISTPVAASAELAGVGASGVIDLPIPAGRDTVLSEDGTFIRLTGLRHPLLLGSEYPLLLAFERGGLLQADLDIAYDVREVGAPRLG